jgi:hypothetical protein
VRRQPAAVRNVCLAMVVLALAATGCGLAGRGPAHTSTSPSSQAARWQLPDLGRGGAARSLVSVFDQDVGTARLVLLVSPT